MQTQKTKGRFHYGLEFAMSHSEVEIEEAIRKLEAKQNRQRAKERSKFYKLQEQLKAEIGTAFGKRIEAELDGKFRKLRNLRMKG